MGTRSASPSLTGYHYQFNKSVLEVLNATAPVTLEEVEDIDLAHELIQCKYYAGSKFVRSLLKHPLNEFLKHFLASPAPPRYRLFGYYQNQPAAPAIALSDLKAILGSDYKAADAKAQTFLDKHLVLDFGVSFDQLRKSVHDALCKRLSCTKTECDLYFFNNALVEVYRLARQPTKPGRTTTRSSFLTAINSKHVLLPHWLALLQGIKEYAKHVGQEITSRNALAPYNYKWLFIGDSFTASVQDLTALCLRLVEKYFKIGKHLRDAKPFTVVLASDKQTLTDLKRALLKKECSFNDGFEYIGFEPWAFNRESLINVKPTKGSKAATDYIGDASYCLRLIGFDTYKLHAAKLAVPDSAFVVGADQSIQVSKDCPSVFRLADFKTVNDLLKCI
jgi:hypothetical protein